MIGNQLGSFAAGEDIEELASDVFVARWQAGRTLQTEHLRGWLGRVARNQAISFLRKQRLQLVPDEDYLLVDERDAQKLLEAQERSDLINWIGRRFRALGKGIDAQTAEHLIFTCGALMTGLVPEIEKIGAYAKGKNITIDDINAVADPVLDAVVFDMTNAITKRDYGRASELLGQLLKKQEEPFVILAVISKELRRIYTARIALDNGRDKLWLMELWGMRSDYPARLLLEAARKTTDEWCSQSLLMCQRLDQRMKSEKGIDSEGELKLLLMRLAQGK